ncbi:hypothetical protein LIER_21709 [Lithospermum erythrorhizon]|uniref:TFIIF beta subunit N-terminal domain-containing protein n=1 Tax=Lithospermum erythrorhizon TaxID=34254 RepID=A0AAV3QU58_LITER
MEEDEINGGDIVNGGIPVDTAKSDRAVWLMKCPPVVSKAWQNHSAESPPVAKVVVSLDPLQSNPDSQIQV